MVISTTRLFHSPLIWSLQLINSTKNMHQPFIFSHFNPNYFTNSSEPHWTWDLSLSQQWTWTLRKAMQSSAFLLLLTAFSLRLLFDPTHGCSSFLWNIYGTPTGYTVFCFIEQHPPPCVLFQLRGLSPLVNYTKIKFHTRRTVAQFEALCCKPENSGFDSLWDY
jgi:hypothetical protein